MIEHRMLIRRKGGALAFYPDEGDGPCCTTTAGPEALCRHCAAAYARLVESGLIAAPSSAARAAAKPKAAPTIAFRAATRGDGWTAAEHEEVAELVADIRALRGGQPSTEESDETAGLRALEARAERRRGIHPISRSMARQAAKQLGRKCDLPAIGAKPIPRPYDVALRASRTQEQAADAEIRAASRAIGGPPLPYTRDLARRQVLEEVRTGRQEPQERPRKFAWSRPPKPYDIALRRKGVA